MGVTDWRQPGDRGPDAAQASGGSGPGAAPAPGVAQPEPKAWPGAMGPPRVGPPPRANQRPQLTPAAQMGAWQGALRPPVFVVNQPRPTYREPLPVRGAMVAAGAAVAAAWMLLFGLQAGTARAYVWLTIVAGVLAWATAAVLARFGDRGAAVGVALSSGIGVAIAGLLVATRLAGGDWLLW